MAASRARALRKSMTPQEVKLWLRLRALRAVGHHFRRQSPLAPYVVDLSAANRASSLRLTATSMVSRGTAGAIIFATKN
jgi:very-short-patch-repair endonuclease